MLKLPTYLVQGLFFVCLLLTAIYLFLIYLNYNNLELFNYLNGYFSAVLIAGILNALYQRDSKIIDYGTPGIMRSPFLTMLLLIVHAIIIAAFIRKMFLIGFQNANTAYWQVSSIVLALMSTSILIKTHVDLLKERDKNHKK